MSGRHHTDGCGDSDHVFAFALCWVSSSHRGSPISSTVEDWLDWLGVL
jgi:hypothetical protein